MSCLDLKNKYNEIVENLKTNIDTINFLSDINDLLLKDSNCSMAYLIRGNFNAMREEFESAKRDFRRAFDLDSSSIYSSYFLAMLYNIENENDSAYYFLNKSIRSKLKGNTVLEFHGPFQDEFDISYDELIFFRGVIYFEERFIEYAKKDFIESITQDYKIGEASSYLAAIYSSQNQTDSACYFYKKSISASNSLQIDSTLTYKCGNE